MEMTKYKLGDVATIYDGPHATPKRTDNGPVYLGIDAITEDCKINPNEFTFLSEEDYKIWTKRVVPQFKDIVFSYEATLGRYAIIPENFYGCLGRRLGIIRVKSDAVDYKWLYYFFQSPQWKCYIKNHIIKGSTVNRISVDEMPGYEIPACGIADQKKIASVLSALDDKIALNKKMNQKLEAMAKRLYDYWFVQYDFPDKNGHPYKTTGGPMTYNPTLKREIPEGWEVSNICPLMEILPGGTPSKAKPEYWNGEIPFFGPTDYCGDVFQLSTEEYITESGLNNCASALYPPKTIFITARGSVGKLIVCGKPMAMNQSCYALKPFDLEKYEYLFYLTKQLIEQLKKKGSGSVFKSINTLDIEQSFLSIAPNEIIDLYCKKVKSIFERIKSNTVEIAKLTALRDKLLPLLMNGQVKVK